MVSYTYWVKKYENIQDHSKKRKYAIFFYSDLTLTAYFYDKNMCLMLECNTTVHKQLKNSPRKAFCNTVFQSNSKKLH